MRQDIGYKTWINHFKLTILELDKYIKIEFQK